MAGVEPMEVGASPTPPQVDSHEVPDGYVPYGAEPVPTSAPRVYFALFVLCVLRSAGAICQLVYTLQRDYKPAAFWEMYAWGGATLLAALYGTAAVLYVHNVWAARLISVVADLYVIAMTVRNWIDIRDGAGANIALTSMLLVPGGSLLLATLSGHRRQRLSGARGRWG